MTDPGASAARGRATYRWLAAVPALLLLGGLPFVNRVRPIVLGLPLLLFWIVCCVLLTSIVMAAINVLDGRRTRSR